MGYSFISKELPDGNIDFEEGKSYQVKIILKDYAQNKTQIVFYVEGIAAPFAEEVKVAENTISPDKDYLYLYDHHEVYIPKNCFYRPVSLPIVAQKDTLKIEAEQFPQRKGFELKFGFSPTLDSLSRQQLCLAKYNPKTKKKKPFELCLGHQKRHLAHPISLPRNLCAGQRPASPRLSRLILEMSSGSATTNT